MLDLSPIPLRAATLDKLPHAVETPAYDRARLIPHTLHIGIGGFHRAHQALYLDELLAMPDTERWGECGIGVLPADVRMRDALKSQDFLYTLAERSANGQTARVIGSMTGFLLAPEEREAVLEQMAAATTRIISLTITEGGYFLNEGTGEFLAEDPAIQQDLANPGQPATSIGLIAEALDRRRLRGLPPCTIMSCDNLQENGHVVSRVLRAYSSLCNPALERWIAENVAFPNSMVDRITPATTPADIEWLRSHFGIDDAWPVVTEPFRQWVIEDTFANGRPQWERVGAQFTTDVASFEVMKIRLLNGSHLAMAYLGALMGYVYVQDILADPLLVSFVEAFMEEVTPVVPVIAGVSVTDYKRSLLERFSNPTINDQVTRICSEGSAKIPKWLLPSIQELLDAGAPTRLLSLVLASWIFYLGRGKDRNGHIIQIVDARAAELTSIASAAGTDPGPMLGIATIFGSKLPADNDFVVAISNALQMLARLGPELTISAFLAQTHVG